jgi:DNA recombination protein RmuC
MADWELQKEHSIQAAKSAVLSAGSELSNKLLEDHKREALETKKQQTEQVRLTSERLMEQFQLITESVAAIRQTSGENKVQMDTVMRALTNPTGAGKMAEVGLENLLKNFGLIPIRDFIMQYHIASDALGTMGSLKPDAVVFLPQDMIIAIDCKASKHLIELEDSAHNETEDELLARLKKTMDQHLRTLASKDYKTSVEKQLLLSGHRDYVGHSFNVMYVPSEMAVERIRQADPEIEDKLIRSNVHMTGPSGLFAIFQLAKEQIATAQRDENNEEILATLSSLLEGVAVAFSHVDKVGISIKSSMDHFEKFARSANSNMIPKMRKLDKLGVKPAKNKSLPSPLAQYDVRRIDETVTIEADEPSAPTPRLAEVK